MIYNATLYQVDHLMCRILLKYTSYFDFGREHGLKLFERLFFLSLFFCFVFFVLAPLTTAKLYFNLKSASKFTFYEHQRFKPLLGQVLRTVKG